MGTHFLQSEAFSYFQKSLGKILVQASGDGWSYRAYFEKSRIAPRLYAPYGPEISAHGSFKEAAISLQNQAKSSGAVFLRVEPTGDVDTQELIEMGFKLVEPQQPDFTQLIRIDRPLEDVFGDMKKNIRNLHRTSEAKGLSVVASTQPNDIEHLIRLFDFVSKRTGMIPRSPEFLRATAKSLVPSGYATIYLVYSTHTSEPIAAALIFDDPYCRYYIHAASDTNYRKLNAGTILISHMIEDGVLAGKKYIDLFGVVPADKTEHPWFGFSEFKRSFGGEQKQYLGTWELPIRKLRYSIYLFLHRILNISKKH